ncbi:MAG: L,D-transpeptidase [Solirubrobacterales bacterium]|nr:L,D-transpeptidase [Solirubrobacterales bacterium]
MSTATAPRQLIIQPERSPKGKLLGLGALAAPIIVVVALVLLILTSSPGISASAKSLATLKMPFGGGKVTKLSAVIGNDQHALPVKAVGNEVYPTTKVPTGSKVKVFATIQRPGWDAWLAGKTKNVQLHVTTPVAKLTQGYLSVKPGQALNVRFSQPVVRAAYGISGKPLTHKTFTSPAGQVTVPQQGTAGTLSVLATPRSWERSSPQAISWFPAGTGSTAAASPGPGQPLGPSTPITLTFSDTVSKALHGKMPTITPAGSGSWHTLNAHSIRFIPTGYGYGINAHVSMSLPAGVHLVGSSGPVGSWTTPQGSMTRLQELLAQTGYLPVNWHGPGAGTSMAAQLKAAAHPPKGSFVFRYGNTPAALKGMWSPGHMGEITKGALMAFENSHDLTQSLSTLEDATTPATAVNPTVWKTLIKDAIAHKVNTFGYTFVSVSKASQSESTWHNGKTTASGAVNTGQSSSPTASGTFAVFEHTPVTTMSGTNPDGTPYHDKGIKWVSYFNGGDALHAFNRASYGSPQSDGCVEMPDGEAASVYQFTPIGTIVQVN